MKARLLLPMLGLVIATAGHAQMDLYTIAEPQTVRLGAFGGVLLGGDTEDQSPVLGVDLVYQVTQRFSLEFVAAFSRDDFPEQSFVDQGVEFVTDADMNLQVFSLLARLDQPLASRVSVYGAAGVGYHRFDTSGERTVANPETIPESFSLARVPLEVNVDNELGLHLAGGLLVVLSDFFEFFLEYRYTLVDRNLEYIGGVEVEREVEATVPGETPGSTTTEMRIITERASGGTSVDGSYNYGMARAGINCHF